MAKKTKKKKYIRKVFKTSYKGQLFLGIPKDSDIKEGDYVEFSKLDD